VLVEVDDTEWPTLKSPAELKLVWVQRQPEERTPAADLLRTLRTLAFPPGRSFAWVALESHSARAVRRYLKDERGIGQEWIKAAAYWRRGAVGVHERIEDDA
jgi:NADPH-dependent ferric siderophore reductase